MPSIEQGDERNGGFTLIEVIVSFVILSMVLASTTLSISYSARLYRKADEIREASQLGEKLIAEKFGIRPGQATNETGSEGDMNWKISRSVIARDVTAAEGRLIRFDLEISDRKGVLRDRYTSMYVERNP